MPTAARTVKTAWPSPASGCSKTRSPASSPPSVQIDPGNPYQIAEYYAHAFIGDAKKLGLKVAIEADRDPSLMPRATANIDGMKRVIDALIARGHAYVAGAPGRRAVYFDVQKFENYGKLSRQHARRPRGPARAGA